MNNANFRYDCRNNANNTKSEPIIDEINEVSYIKKYYNLFDKKFDKFVRSEVLERQNQDEYEQELVQIWEDDPFKNARRKEAENTKQSNLDALK